MKGYFEGWYFKLVSQDQKHVYAIIPGISFSKDGDSHAFIQFFNGKETSMEYFKFETSDFSYAKNKFRVTIDNNIFSTDKLELNLEKGDLKIQGKITFDDFTPWPVSLFFPGAMGWYAFVPFMECYHGVVSFDHALQGSLFIRKKATKTKKIDFSEGRGYIEKDWGSSFPEYWIWMQSNHFSQTGTSLMLSVASIPWLGHSFDGFLVGFLHQDKLYRFTTYSGAKITDLKLNDLQVNVTIQDKKHRLEIHAEKNEVNEGVELLSPIQGSMEGRILESITADINIKFYKMHKSSEELIYAGSGKNSGLELGGAVEKLSWIK